jgi:hypothetical protein
MPQTNPQTNEIAPPQGGTAQESAPSEPTISPADQHVREPTSPTNAPQTDPKTNVIAPSQGGTAQEPVPSEPTISPADQQVRQPTSPTNAPQTDPQTNVIAPPQGGTAQQPAPSEPTISPSDQQVRRRCSCKLCPNGVLRGNKIVEMSVNGKIQTASCDAWHGVACDFPEACNDFRAGVGTECCANTQTRVNQTQAQNVTLTAAQGEVRRPWLIGSFLFKCTKFLALSKSILFLVCMQYLSRRLRH